MKTLDVKAADILPGDTLLLIDGGETEIGPVVCYVHRHRQSKDARVVWHNMGYETTVLKDACVARPETDEEIAEAFSVLMDQFWRNWRRDNDFGHTDAGEYLIKGMYQLGYGREMLGAERQDWLDVLNDRALAMDNASTSRRTAQVDLAGPIPSPRPGDVATVEGKSGNWTVSHVNSMGGVYLTQGDVVLQVYPLRGKYWVDARTPVTFVRSAQVERHVATDIPDLPPARRTYTLKTVADLPYGCFPEYPVGPALVALDDWRTSVGIEHWAEGDKFRVGAFKVISDDPYVTERHPLDKQYFPTYEAADKARYDAGLTGYMVYDDTKWASYSPRKVGDTVEIGWPDGSSTPWTVTGTLDNGHVLRVQSQRSQIKGVLMWEVREIDGKRTGDWYLMTEGMRVNATFPDKGNG